MSSARLASQTRSFLLGCLLAGILAAVPRPILAADPVQVYMTLLNFQYSNGAIPHSALIAGGDGFLYGTTYSGWVGTVFKIRPDGTGHAILYSFQGTAADGWYPAAGLVLGSDGALYGTTKAGGSADAGTIFKLNRDGTNYSILHSFENWPDGSYPRTAMVQASNGVLYGTTGDGGSSYGVLFQINTDGTGYTILHTFQSSGGDGMWPAGSLVQASDGALYGTTAGGGSSGNGTVFKINTTGTGYAVVYSFAGSDGQSPDAGLIQGGDGTLFGTTYSGGSAGVGTVFKIMPDGSNFAVLHHFQSSGGEGQHPMSGLLLTADGTLFGTTYEGGSANYGTLFKLNRDGTNYSVLHSLQNSPDGANPYAALMQGGDGGLYGTASQGGTNGYGTVFALKFPASVTATQGASQTAACGTSFPAVLQATVRNSSGVGVSGISVTFAGPGNGASGTFASSATVASDLNGVATAPAFTANTIAGAYTVTAAVAGLSTPASFNLVNAPGPLDRFAFVLTTPQSNGVAFTGTNTLTARDASGNTVTTFDASVDNVRITANAPLIGNVSGLGTDINNVLNRATDFVSGVADLTALGMIYGGSLATGTFTATSATGKTGTSGSVTIGSAGPGQTGKEMQVVMWLTIPKSVSIAWGAGTTGKTAGDVSPVDWTVRDSADGLVGLGATCVTGDAHNNVGMILENMSNTGTNARVSAAVVNTGGWNIAGAPATDTFAIQAQLGPNAQATLSVSAQELTGTSRLAKGSDQALVVTVMTPTVVTRDAGVPKVIFVTLTAVPE